MAKLHLNRQGEIIRALAAPQQAVKSDAYKIAEAVFKKFRDSTMEMQVR